MYKYQPPNFLEKFNIDRVKYNHWLDRKSKSLYRRDIGRFKDLKEKYSRKSYKEAIHEAVINSDGKDFYTGEVLQWSKISEYDNEKSSAQRGVYRKKFSYLPTVDHYDVESEILNFKICGWRTNDSKSDMSYIDYIKLCQLVLNENKRKRQAT